MTRKEALKFWEWRYENAKDYYDDHWEADERRSHREYVQALEWAVKALADRKTEPTISKMEQVDKDINVRSKDEPKTQTETQNSNLTFEMQTDCAWK